MTGNHSAFTARFHTWLRGSILEEPDEEGQDMVEYALLAALISIVALAIIVLLGPYLLVIFQDVINGLGKA